MSLVPKFNSALFVVNNNNRLSSPAPESYCGNGSPCKVPSNGGKIMHSAKV